MSSSSLPQWHPVVAVPARDEEKRLPILIEALGRQTWLAAGNGPLPLTIILNNCTDASAAVARAAARRFPAIQLDLVEIDFPAEVAHVGSARRLAMERALTTVSDRARVVILTTDADAAPHPDWIEANLAAIARGADLVGGHLFGDRAEEAQLGPAVLRRAAMQLRYDRLADRLASLLDPLPHDPWPRHRDHTGGSLAVRGDVYCAVGGLPAEPSGEDIAFASVVRGAGYHLRHAPDVKVTVSARLAGRAPGGMADCLKEWMRAEADGRPLLVETPASLERRLRQRRLLRQLGLAGDQAAIAEAASIVGHPVGLFYAPDGSPLPATRLIEQLTPEHPDAPPLMHADGAIVDLELMIAALEGRSVAA
ncbi:glycosyltransferase [Mangrovicella endophytica]|uniref:glycosyltransferase n=1 Tax=Mangrovicella endophytica TaxID=2066697 RepID=UPI000C9E9078|nr:glycosyltransferase family 2 protein [Mangrovicella endophytica]